MNTRLYEAFGVAAGRVVSSDEAALLRTVELFRKEERRTRRAQERSAD